MAWSDPQLHVSPVAAALVKRVAPVENRHFHKPKYGLWTSTYDAAQHTSAWVEWCLVESFGDVLAGGWFVLRPELSARVFIIDGVEDLKHLVAHYPQPGAEPYMRFMACLDFERLADEYDAIHLTEHGQWATRHSMPHLNGWDVESTLWFRWCFTSVRRVSAVAVSGGRRGMYSGTWSSREEVAQAFGVELPPNIHIVFAHYSGYDSADESDYEMWARVLFRDAATGKLYEVHGSHCSCYGLEDQWEPQEVTIQDIVSDLNNPNNRVWGAEVVVRKRLRQALLALA